MTIPDRLRTIDDLLLDRVFQPIVDFASPIEVLTWVPELQSAGGEQP